MESARGGDSDTWVDLGPEAQEADMMQKRVGERLFLCVRTGESLQVVDGRCPHQGYPLVAGTLSGDLLTCEWHNWKFDVRSGGCVTGGDNLRVYPSRIRAGRLEANLAIDKEKERVRVEKSLLAALFDADVEAGTREALRLTDLQSVDAAFALMVADGATRAPWGFSHSLAATADLWSWVEQGILSDSEGLSVATFLIGNEMVRHTEPPPKKRGEADVLTLLRADNAEAAATGASSLSYAELQTTLLDYLATGLLGYGHGAIYSVKARELSRRLGPSEQPALCTSVTRSLGWMTREGDLPPFRKTKTAMAEIPAALPRAVGEQATVESETMIRLLAGETSALSEALRLIQGGTSPRDILTHTARAAAHRVFSYDRALSETVERAVTILHVTHALTFAEACLDLLDQATESQQMSLAIQAASFVGKLQRASPASDEPYDSTDPSFAELAREAALEAGATPIWSAHYIKMTESLRKLAESDPAFSDGYRAAATRFVRTPNRERHSRRQAGIAAQFLVDGRPPKALY